MKEHTTTIIESRRPFVPGMGVDWLLPIYDPFTRLLRLDQARRELLLQGDLRPGHRVLDIGCGTGSLVVLAKQLFPDVEVVGVDPDEKALTRATRKAQRVGASIQFDRGFSDALDHPDASFDRVFSSFMFHHLERDEKEPTLREIQRVLKPGGSLHLLDFGGSDEHTILALLRTAGFSGARKTAERTVLRLIRIVYYRAGR